MGKNVKLIESIISLEWDMFQKVKNIGGRAGCQDDHETFTIMRRSQYENWTDEMLLSYYTYALSCVENGRNLVTEKYARMMEYTDPHYYKEHIEDYLPYVPDKNRRLINEIVEIMVAWGEELAKQYPKLSSAGRPITAAGDSADCTSQETYERGELATYPTDLLELYAAYLKELRAQGKSLAVMIQETMAGLYGYKSIGEAEASL